MVSEGSQKKWLKYFQYRMLRQKEVGRHDTQTELRRCLNTAQLAMLGVGSTVGVGIYVLLGVVAKENAGPSAVICFIAAILVMLINALVYAEFSTYIPQTGALYVYIYKVAGEFAGFLCGWLLLIATITSGSVGAQAWSGMVDSFFNNTIQEFTEVHLGTVDVGVPIFANTLDIVACVFELLVVFIVSFNVSCSSIINSILGVLTILILVLVFFAGIFLGDVNNFINADHGGFFPFGLSGVVKGTSLALYACTGFEVIALSAEEAKDPSRAVPRAIMGMFFLVGVVYIGAAVGLLFLCPYWLLDERSPLPSAFEYSGIIWGQFIVTVGPLFAITNLQMLNLYGGSRILYRMAADGLFFPWFLKVDRNSGVPRNSVMFLGVLISLAALLFDLSYIVTVTVLLMITGYISLSCALIKLKIRETNFVTDDLDDKNENKPNGKTAIDDDGSSDEYPLFESKIKTDEKNPINNYNGHSKLIKDDQLKQIDITEDKLKQIETTLHYNESENAPLLDEDVEMEKDYLETSSGFVKRREPRPLELKSDKTNYVHGWKENMASLFTSLVPGLVSVNVLLLLHFVTCFTVAMLIIYGSDDLATGHPVAVIALVILTLLLIFFSVLLGLQCGPSPATGFQTPLMPLIPTLGITVSSMLLLSTLELASFIVGLVLLFLGSTMYIVMVMTSLTWVKTGGDFSETETLVGRSEPIEMEAFGEDCDIDEFVKLEEIDELFGDD